MEKSKDKSFNLDKYNEESRKAKLSYDFQFVAHWMKEHCECAQSLAQHIASAHVPRRSVAESENLANCFNHVIDFCNKVLTAPEQNQMRNNPRLRTAIRRIRDFSATVTDPLDCQKTIKIIEFAR